MFDLNYTASENYFKAPKNDKCMCVCVTLSMNRTNNILQFLNYFWQYRFAIVAKQTFYLRSSMAVPEFNACIGHSS